MVFMISIAAIVFFVIWGFFFPSHLGASADMLLDATTRKFGWFYLLAALAFLLLALYLAFSKYGSIKLGDDDDEPEYSNLSWFSMLFSAGMGIGLVFWGVAEPVSHFALPPMEAAEPYTPEAARLAMRYSFFHWGLHPWAIYSIIALSMAYFTYRRGERGLVSHTFLPLLGNRVHGLWGKAIDILAVIATAFGVATSLGLGTLQINGGLTHIAGVPNSFPIQLTIILLVTVLFMISTTTGLDKGIKTLSSLNVWVAAGLLASMLLLGPASFIFDVLTTTIGGYVQNLIQMSLRLTPFSQGTWVGSWTLFYWAWWIAWAPFVGMFIARISKGRTIKEFVLGVLIVPSLFSFLWFSAFGGAAIHMQLFEGQPVADAVLADTTTALFITLGHVPGGIVLSVLATLLVLTFFITSADSATFVLGMMSSEGRSQPTLMVKLIWGVLLSAIAVALLYSGGLTGLQRISIVTALPFAVIMCFMCVSLLKALQQEDRERKRREQERRRELDRLLHRS